MSPVRRLGGAAVVYGLGGVLSRMVGMLMLPFLTKYLTPTDYGIVAMLGVMSSLLAGAVSLGTGNSMGICYHEAKNESEKNTVVWSTGAVVFISAMSWLALGALSSTWLSRLLFHSDGYALEVVLGIGQMAASSVAAPFLGRWRLEEKARAYTVATLCLGLTTAVATLGAVVIFEKGVLGMLGAGFIVQSVFATILIAAHWRSNKASFRTVFASRVVSLGWPSIFGVGAFFAMDFSGRIMLEHFTGLHELGIYSLGLSFGLVMVLVADNAFGAAWPAFFMSYLNRRDEAIETFGKVLRYFLTLYLTICAGFFLFARPVIELLVAVPFYPAAKIVGWIAFCSVLKCVYLIFLPGFYFERKLHMQTAIEWLAAVVCVAASLILIPSFGLMGAAFAQVMGYVTLCGAAFMVGKRYLPIRIEVRTITFMVSIFAGVVAVSGLRWVDSLWVEAMLRLTFYMGLCLLMWGLFIKPKIESIRALVGKA
jgi:O-antigen/teichoic acid export membrane protein